MFKNKIVLVTGGSSGIGAATAVLFAKEGAAVAIVGRNVVKLEEVAEKCTTYGSQVLTIKADVSKDEDTDVVVKQAIDKFGKIDVLVNNAGILREADILSDNFLDTFDEVNVSSIAGTRVLRPNCIAYRTSKAALNHFTRSCALELAKHGVRVNSVSPGPTKTNIFDGLAVGADALKAQTALKKISECEEIADLIIYLASDKAKSITGSDYIIDNGTSLL
ncbi:unnamed protein product [Arctia plantaginis]|uniref:Ketoreductase domain-containing protein n=1 Tax=Arctia plantaginis TaxID=874455 RepID=A0A8S1BCX8_ARCPL|nr:unnamed protein product [Arctia plantaginis]